MEAVVVELDCNLFAYFFSLTLFQRVRPVGTNVAARRGVRPEGGGCNGTHAHAFVHIHAHRPAHKHTHALTHAGTHPLHVCVFAQTACLSLSLPPHLVATCRGNFCCLVVEMVTFVASWYDCTSKQSGYVQLPVREDSEKSVDQKDAIGSPAFRNYDLIFIVSPCLSLLCF